MDIAVSEQAERQIAERVATGAFASPEAVIDEALRILQRHEARRAEEYAWLEEKLARAIAQLDRGEGIDGPAYFARLKARILASRDAAA